MARMPSPTCAPEPEGEGGGNRTGTVEVTLDRTSARGVFRLARVASPRLISPPSQAYDAGARSGDVLLARQTCPDRLPEGDPGRFTAKSRAPAARAADFKFLCVIGEEVQS